ncbi:thioredoxin h isoform 1 [Salpingoeca rosetta]|uniref:Thioredoxin h isoform 1 n=1 Tax=Salpingoeca rosetta (strain ATCC 50818 / BSB-021) TaxID=946362 RepID=F2UP30_SALR5|nr:thioredoxin h isoform 1 [Salpingoeca rosetta]EGD79385.1 thioredoxin h isoform 1 [Salpingoeca rosetta]|eukprot:XP_004989154.1 thioredoxin h isoform 1 [Salpingoeca rosetta]
MIICIGPVCIPLWGLFPFLLVLLSKAWAKIKSWLGIETAAAPETPAEEQKETTSNVLHSDKDDKGTRKTAIEASSGDATEEAASKAASDTDGLRARKPDKFKAVVQVESVKHFQDLMREATDKGWPLVVKFTAVWCKPCKAIQPHYQQLAAKLPGIFLQVDVDEVDELADRYRVNALPTFLVVKDRKRLFSSVVISQEELTSVLQQHCS